MLIRDLFEAPISDISHIGDFDKSSSFRHAQDRKLLTNPKAISKIKSMWRFPEETDFNIILVNHPDGNRHTEVGVVDRQWLESNMPRIWPELSPALRSDQINIIFTNNKGDRRVPMTGWIMAHRFGHALWASSVRGPNDSSQYYFKEAVTIFSSTLKDIMAEYGVRWNSDYMPSNGPLLGFLHAVCTFRSARERNIRAPFEAILECLAQYMTTGRISFNEAPARFRYGNQVYRLRDADDVEYVNRMLDGMFYQLKDYFEASIGYSEGKIFVM